MINNNNSILNKSNIGKESSTFNDGKVIMRDENAAKAAYLAKDPELSRAVHSKKILSNDQKNKLQGYLKVSSMSIAPTNNSLDELKGTKNFGDGGYGTMGNNNTDESDKYYNEKDKLISQSQLEEGHRREGHYIKSVVFGGLDGILTSFSIVSGATGGGLTVSIILLLGLSNVFADALSMGLGDALSSKADNEYIMMERKREYWEFDNYVSIIFIYLCKFTYSWEFYFILFIYEI